MSKFLSYAFIFYLGRLSYMVWQNNFLEDKRKRLHNNADELIKYGDDLMHREQLLKDKYKELINTIADFRAETEGNTSKWSNYDDILMEQWSKADK